MSDLVDFSLRATFGGKHLKPSEIVPGMNLLLLLRDATMLRVWARRVVTTDFGVVLEFEPDALYHQDVEMDGVCLINTLGERLTLVINKSTGRTGLGRREAA